jgi:mono/diheme cytochrome c family protein
VKRYRDWDIALPPSRKAGTGVREAPKPDKASWKSDPKLQLKAKRYKQFMENELSERALKLLAEYVSRTIPDPIHSEGFWSLAAYPSNQLLFRLSMGTTETLWAGADWPGRRTHLNVAADDESIWDYLEDKAHQERLVFFAESVPYHIAKYCAVCHVICGDLQTAFVLLGDEMIADAAYRLNCSLITHTSPVHRKDHNWPFGNQVLTAANRVS